MSPQISIVLPTYNRADTLPRAIESMRAQRFEDWELDIVDDGSTDHTRELFPSADPRVRYFPRPHAGVAAARNFGLAEARGTYIGLLDSDDVYTPHHLALAAAFFAAHPGEHVYSSEMWEDFGHDYIVRHFHTEVEGWYPATAAAIGSTDFAAAPPGGDPYLRIYTEREPVGAWGRSILDDAGLGETMIYRGNIFQQWRWGWLLSIVPTVITRHALETVGPFDTRIPVASDFSWLIALCRHFPVSYVAAPAMIKHELAGGGRALAEGHLATGKTAVQFHVDVLKLHEELFWKGHEDDRELSALRGFRQFLVGQAAAKHGMRDMALEHLRASKDTYRTFEARELRWLVEMAPTEGLVKGAYRLSTLPVHLRARVDWLRHKVA